MPTCPDCGSIVMEGDPYCPHCGAHLQWSDNDEYQRSQSDGDNVEGILNSMFLSPHKKLLLKNKVVEFLNAKDVKGLEVRPYFDAYIFAFTRENEYVRTVNEFYYFRDYDNETRVFEEVDSRHNHDNLVNNPRFKEMIEKTGFELLWLKGGYVCEYTMSPDEFRLKDEIRIDVHLKVSDAKKRVYELDLNNMRLSGDYGEYDL